MDEQLARAIGERVRARRTAGRRKKTVVAGLAGITTDYLYQIERGMKVPTVAVLTKLAEVLGVSVAELLNQEPATSCRSSNTAAGKAIYRALVSPMLTISEPPLVAEVHERVAQAWRIWQTSPQRYSQLAGQLPQLIVDTESVVQAHKAEAVTGLRHARSCAADLYCLVRTVTKRLGRLDLSLLAADRAVRAAEAANDALRLGVAQWNIAQVLLADGQAEGAEMVAMRAADALHPLTIEGETDSAAVYGALLLIGAVAVARQGDTWTAHSRLREAAPLAERAGECNTLWTAFGPTNVAMYAVTVEIEGGEAAEGLRLAEQIDHRHSPEPGRPRHRRPASPRQPGPTAARQRAQHPVGCSRTAYGARGRHGRRVLASPGLARRTDCVSQPVRCRTTAACAGSGLRERRCCTMRPPWRDPVIREDRELLAELAQINTAMAPLAMRIMDDSASAVEQAHYARRLIAAGERLQRRADEAAGTVIEGEVLANGPLTLPPHTVEPHWEP